MRGAKTLPVFNFNNQKRKNEVIQHMRKFFDSIRNKFGKAVTTVKATVESTTGEGYIDTGVKIVTPALSWTAVRGSSR